MIVIQSGNSYSQIIGLDRDQFNRLKAVLSYTVDQNAAFYGGFGPRIKYLLDVKGFFPSGLTYRVQSFLKSKNLVYKVEDLRIVPTVRVDLSPKFEKTPYPDQDFAALSAISYGRGIISMPTGTGKSLVIALIIAKLRVKTLVVVPSLGIKEQLTESLEAIFGPSPHITVLNIDSKELKTAKGYDCLIIDESHHVAAKTFQVLNKTAWKDIYHRYFLTATPFRNQIEEQLLFEGIAGQVIYKLSYKDAVKKGYIVPVEAYYLDLPKQEINGETWSQVYSELVVNNQSRNQEIASLINQLYLSGVHTLCLVKEIAHGDKLSALTGASFANGQDEDTKAFIDWFNQGKIKALIGTTGVLGEGIDTKPAEYIIIAGLGKAKSAFMQAVGRGVRRHGDKESAKIILIRDCSHKFTLRHYNEQVKILKEEYGIAPVKLEEGD